MEVIYTRTRLRKSIFLAGPSPRHPTTPSWRPEAIRLLEHHGFSGTVYNPEDEDALKKYSPEAKAEFSYDDQVEWEIEALHASTVVLFWVPRDIETMPAFTTNVEFGHFVSRRNVVLGFPKDAPKMTYLKALANMYHVDVFHTLENTVKHAIAISEGPFLANY